MSRKTKIDKKADNVELRYSNWLATIIQMIKPKDLTFIGGRGTSKTTDILAERTMDISYEMPGCYVALSSDTYMNAAKNVMPSIIEGWERNGWIEGIHFVVGERPPKHFKKPYKSPISFKHTMTTFTGTHFKLISQDRPSTGAGDSYQHVIADEVKYQAEKKINKLVPAIRGKKELFGKSPYYRGKTFTTDMPNPNHGEHDWFLKGEKNMDKKQIKMLVQTAFILNDIEVELLHAKKDGNKLEVQKIEKKKERWAERFRIIRTDSVFFHIASSYVNADILSAGFFKDILQSMDFKEVMTSILSISPKLEKGLMFYANMGKHNLFRDSFIYKQLDKEINPKTHEFSSLDLKHINHNSPIEGGMDTGNMCSLVLGQPESNKIYRILKELYTIPPAFLPVLAQKFREYFKYHKRKELILYHDRAANAYESVGEDHASKFKKAIEFDNDGNSTGWIVTLMNRNQATILQQKEYELLLEMLNDFNRYNLPMLLIDAVNCPCLVNAMGKTIKIIKVDKNGKKTIHKDKSSEKLALELLPMNSTNLPDAMKYLLCRPEYTDLLKGYVVEFSGMPGIH
ncbi:MAG: hypothetical protein HRT69_17030 [Flavobacteriaceae bacterium]|nr:hypothetical protein [Flavobacteriaceae bacterium]